jgi:hypothetical protein
MTNKLEIIKKYINLMKSNLSFSNIRKMPFYQDIEEIAERMAIEQNVTDELSFQVENTIVILTKLETRWTFMLPYWNSEVIEYYSENPPQDYTGSL